MPIENPDETETPIAPNDDSHRSSGNASNAEGYYRPEEPMEIRVVGGRTIWSFG